MASDDELWDAVTESVTPLKKKSSVVSRRSSAKTPDQVRSVTPTTKEHIPDKRSADPGSPSANLPDLTPNDLTHIDGSKAKKLKRGELSIDARLDLHGMTQVQAQDALEAFIPQCRESGKRCALVITGKGEKLQGALRTRLPEWLNLPALRPHILAFTQAQPQHGGAGAWYLYLKRK